MSDPFGLPIDAATRYCAVFGCPVRHSASPAMQNAGLAALGLNWRYLAFQVQPEELGPALAGAKLMGFIGLNLTVPHKILAMRMVDFLDESAKLWGAVNTIRFEGQDSQGQWRSLAELKDEPRSTRAHGFNTDADALTRAIIEDLGMELAGARVLVLGAGGAGRTAALKLASEGVADLFLVNRTCDKAKAVAEEIHQRYPEVRTALGYPSGQIDLVLNATSLGLRPEDPLPYDCARFSLNQAGAVYDMVYRPAETTLLRAANAAGCRRCNGLGMLLYQGVKALELWTSQPSPVDPMRRALEHNIYG